MSTHHVLGEAEVDDVADVGDGEGGLGDVGAEDDLPLAVRQRREDAGVLLPGGEGTTLQ